MNNEIENLVEEIAKVKDAFIIEGLKPYYKRENDKIIWSQEVRLRLATINDYKDIIRDRLIREIVNSNMYGWACNHPDNLSGEYNNDFLSEIEEIIEKVLK